MTNDTLKELSEKSSNTQNQNNQSIHSTETTEKQSISNNTTSTSPTPNQTSNTESNIEKVELTILGKTYKLTCKYGEGDNFKKAAKEINSRISELSAKAKNFQNDQLAVLVALDLCHDLYKEQLKNEQISDKVINRINQLRLEIKDLKGQFPQNNLKMSN